MNLLFIFNVCGMKANYSSVFKTIIIFHLICYSKQLSEQQKVFFALRRLHTMHNSNLIIMKILAKKKLNNDINFLFKIQCHNYIIVMYKKIVIIF